MLKLKYLFFIAFFTSSLFANEFIINHGGLIDKRAQDKILEIGAEAKIKLGVHIYAFVMENNGINMDLSREERINLMREFDKKILASVKTKDYAVLTIVVDQVYANILLSESLKSKIDKGDILGGYVIPLLASKDKNTLFAKTSAAVLNGYAQIADELAKQKNIKLDSSMGSQGKTASTIWKMFMYSLVLFGIVAYFIIILRQRKGN